VHPFPYKAGEIQRSAPHGGGISGWGGTGRRFVVFGKAAIHLGGVDAKVLQAVAQFAK